MARHFHDWERCLVAGDPVIICGHALMLDELLSCKQILAILISSMVERTNTDVCRMRTHARKAVLVRPDAARRVKISDKTEGGKS